MNCMYTKFGVDSSSRFSLIANSRRPTQLISTVEMSCVGRCELVQIARTDRQTDRRSHRCYSSPSLPTHRDHAGSSWLVVMWSLASVTLCVCVCVFVGILFKCQIFSVFCVRQVTLLNWFIFDRVIRKYTGVFLLCNDGQCCSMV